MPADLVEGMAREMCWASMCGRPCDAPCDCGEWRDYADEARAAWVYALAALRELAEPMRRPFMNWHLFNEPKLEGAWAQAVDTFAREHGLEVARQEPVVITRFLDGSCSPVPARDNAAADGTEARVLAEQDRILDEARDREPGEEP